MKDLISLDLSMSSLAEKYKIHLDFNIFLKTFFLCVSAYSMTM